MAATSDRLPSGAKAPLGTTAKYSAAHALQRFALQAVSRELLPDQRVARCLRFRQRQAHDVEVWRSVEHGRAHYRKLQTCGSVWHCPVCAAKISERRRVELAGAIATWKASGGDVLLLTLTNSHNLGHRLSDLLSGQSKALARLWTDRASRALFDAVGLVGQVRAVEVTHGDAGWHPHYHVLLFLARPLDFPVGDLREAIARRWLIACVASGLPLPDLAHGVDIRDGGYAARYAAKWGLEHEMTRGHTKTGKRHGRTPWDLLRAVLDRGEGAQLEARLFREFAQAFKGKRQLHWSKGLKARLAVAELTDEQLADQVEEHAELLGRLSMPQWRAILWAGARGHVLAAAEARGWPAVLDLVEDLVSDWYSEGGGWPPACNHGGYESSTGGAHVRSD